MGSARASMRGTDNRRFHALLYVYMANYNDDMNKQNNQKRNLMLKWLLVASLLAPVNVLHSQELVKVEGDYVYYAPENTTVEEAKNTAFVYFRYCPICYLS
ncbi:MAG: hypothetical protein ACI4TD_06930 [Phocaeicola sp.]